MCCQKWRLRTYEKASENVYNAAIKLGSDWYLLITLQRKFVQKKVCSFFFKKIGLYKIRMPIDLGLWIALSQVLGLTFPLVNIASAFLFGTLMICGGYITPQNLFE